MTVFLSLSLFEQSSGACGHRSHYVEYLVSVIYEVNLDPLPILDLTDCVQELRRRGIPLPERGPWDTDPIYREMCLNVKKSFHCGIKLNMKNFFSIEKLFSQLNFNFQVLHKVLWITHFPSHTYIQKRFSLLTFNPT
jgi:hypothetical protein